MIARISERLEVKLLAALTAILALFFLPADPFKGHAGDIAQLEDSDAATLMIYAFVSQNRHFNHELAWSIAEAILEESKRHSLDPLLVLAIIDVESRFKPKAVSSQGARGLMQIHPYVATVLAGEADIENWRGKESLDDPILNIKLGVFYLRQLKNSFKDLRLALTAYNLGPSELKSRLEERIPISFSYARKVLAIHQVYKRQNVPQLS